MSRELRTLHDQMAATTVYVTHDQLEAMQMGDKIVVMNNGSVEQFGVPQEIYDWPSTMFVADFIGSPSMNFLHFNGTVKEGDTSVLFGNQSFDIPVQLENTSGNLVFGVRPEHASLNDDSGLRGEVVATEYLGTTQIVSLATPNGTLKVRVLATQIARVGETVGLDFNPRTITIFDDFTGKALLSEANKGVLKNG
jgi:multiple sugar transport system ATP-binding protein